MNRNTPIFNLLIVALVALGGCSSSPSPSATKKAGPPIQKIQGKAQVLDVAGPTSDAALNSGGPSVFIWEGKQRYRMFFRKTADVVQGLSLIHI